jgi:hypothetical protein
VHAGNAPLNETVLNVVERHLLATGPVPAGLEPDHRARVPGELPQPHVELIGVISGTEAVVAEAHLGSKADPLVEVHPAT